MVDKLVCAIARSLNEVWGESYSVYTENVYQNAKKPCFFIECENTERVKMLGGRFLVRARIAVSIEPDSDTKNAEIEKMTGKLFSLLGFVTIGDKKFFCPQCGGKWEKNAFVVRATYDLPYMEEAEEVDVMETIEVKTQKSCEEI